VKANKEAAHFLRLSDTLRDEIMPQLGVRFEDSEIFPLFICGNSCFYFRQSAEDKKEAVHFLRLCDTLHDEIMPN
jgi:hypothetical protein